MDSLSLEKDIKLRQHRERSDKISSIMGEYLLKGWRMLGETCGTCDTILLMDREGRLYCVGCSDVDGKQTSDTPEVHAVPDTNGGRSPNGASGDKQLTLPPQQRHTARDDTENAVSSVRTTAALLPTSTSIPRALSKQSLETGPTVGCPAPVAAIQDKLLFCLSRLESCDSAEEIQQWAGAIKGLSEAFICLKKCSF
ncbi:Protein ZNRD2 [Sparganum proliferum]